MTKIIQFSQKEFQRMKNIAPTKKTTGRNMNFFELNNKYWHSFCNKWECLFYFILKKSSRINICNIYITLTHDTCE